MANILKVNQQLTIMLSKKQGSQQFKSRIEEVNTDHIVCAMPMSKGRPLIVQIGTKVYGKVVVDGVVYFFASKLMQKKISPLPVWIIELPSDIERIQQRSFVRVDALLNVQATTVSDEEDVESIRVMTKDISGGGTRLIFSKPLDIGTKLSLQIAIPENEVIEASGEVTRIDKPDDERELYWVGVKFTEINEKTRDKLIKFIFKKQIEQRQKGV